MSEPPDGQALSQDAAALVERLRVDVRDQAARVGLQRLFDMGGRAPALLDGLARACQVAQDWAAARPVIEAIARTSAPGEDRLWACRRLAQTCRLAGEHKLALDALRDAMAAVPPDEDTLAFGLELAHETGRFDLFTRAVVETVRPDEAPDLFRQLAALVSDGPDAARLLARMSDALDAEDPIEAHRLRARALKVGPDRSTAHALHRAMGRRLAAEGNAAAAVEHLEEAWAEDDTDREAGSALAETYAALGRTGDLLAVLERQAESAEGVTERKTLWLRVATLHEQRGDDGAAASAYRSVLDNDADDEQARDALCAHYQAHERWGELAELLHDRASRLDGPARGGVLAALGRLYGGPLGDVGAAVEAWQGVRAVAPDDTEALDALSELYADLEHWRDLAEVLARRLARTTNAVEKAALRDRLVHLHAEHPDAGAMPLALLRAIEREYAAAGRWSDLVGVLQREARQAVGRERGHLWARMGALWDEKLEEPALAAEAYWQALAEPELEAETHERLRRGLAALYIGPLNDPHRALESLGALAFSPDLDVATLAMLPRLYDLVGDRPRRQAALERLFARDDAPIEARLDAATTLGDGARGEDDQATAVEWYQRALTLSPDHVPALEGLASVSAAAADHGAQAALLAQMATRIEGPARAAVLMRLGRLHADGLDDAAAAANCFERALEADPDSLDAIRAVGPVWLASGRFTELERLLPRLIEDPAIDTATRHGWLFAAGRCAEAMGDAALAVDRYRAARDLDGQHAPTWRRLAALTEAQGRPSEALEALQMVYVLESEGRSSDQAYPLLLRMGRLQAEAGHDREALDVFHEARALDPGRVEARNSIIELLSARGDWAATAEELRGLLDVIDGAEARRALNMRLADVFEHHLDDRRLAIEAVEYALVEAPDDLAVLERLLALNQEAGDAYAAVDLMKRLAEREATPRDRARRWLALGELLHTEMEDAPAAIRALEQAMEADPTSFEAFRLLERLLLTAQDHLRLDALYRRMLAQAAREQMDDRVVVALATNLGEINRVELRDPHAALEAWNIVLERRPDDIEARKVVAELCEATDQLERAVQQHQHLLDVAPTDILTMQNLRRLYLELGRFDAAWCLCQALSWLGVASPEERAFYDQYRRPGLQAPQATLGRAEWDRVKHVDGSPLLDHLLHRLYPFLLPAIEVSRREAGLSRRKHAIDPQQDTPFNRVAALIADATGLGRLDCYRDPADRPGIRTVPMNPPALLIGPDLDARPLADLAFWLARHLYLTGRQHVLASLDDDPDARAARLERVMATVTRLVQPDAPVDPDPDLLRALKKQRIPPAELADLGNLVQRMRQDPTRHLDVSRWLEALDHSASRLGLLFCGDLGMAMRCIEEAPPFSVAHMERRQALLLRFAVSEGYIDLRRRLGLSIG